MKIDAVALNVSVQIGDAVGDEFPFGVVPGSVANAVAGVGGGLAGGGLRTKIGVPSAAAGSSGSGQLLAVSVGSGEAT